MKKWVKGFLTGAVTGVAAGATSIIAGCLLLDAIGDDVEAELAIPEPESDDELPDEN